MNIETIAHLADGIALIIGSIGALIITFGAVVALVSFFHGLVKKHHPGEDISKQHVDPVRVEFGRYISFGLEFFIAKDVLETMFSTTWTQISQLLVLVLIRTMVSYFLMLEIRTLEVRHKQSNS